MFKNECSRNCWLAAAVLGLLVWLFNATLVGGFVLGAITFVLLGNTLIWLVCNGRGGPAEDAEVLGDRRAVLPEAGDGVLDRAEQAVIDASSAFAAGTVAAVAKGREALQEMRAETRDDDDDDRAEREKKRADNDDEDDDDDDASILERAEERLEKAGDSVKDAMEALASRGRDAIGSLTTRRDEEVSQAVPSSVEAAVIDGARGADPGEPAHVARLSSAVSPSGRSAVPTDPADAHATATDAEATPAIAPKRAKAAKPKPEKTKAEKAAKSKAEKSKAEKSKDRAEKARKTERPKPAKAEKAKPEKIEKVKAPKPEKPAKAEKPKAAKVKAAKPSKRKLDDLKAIKGIGPTLETTLRDNDVTSFDQIAAWSDADIDRFAELIGRMGGRIRSDDWVAQARILAAGGETEFSRRVGKGEVY